MRTTSLILSALVAAVVGNSPAGDKTKSAPAKVEMTFADGSVVHMRLFPAEIEIVTEFGKLSVPVNKIRRIDFGVRVPEAMAKKVDSAIAGLGSTDFKVRQEAKRELVALGAHAYPALLQAVRSKDPDVSKSAGEALDQIKNITPTQKIVNDLLIPLKIKEQELSSKYGPEYPALKLVRAGIAEIRKRYDLKDNDELPDDKAKVSAKDLNIPADDKIVTKRFIIVGRIVTPSIKAKSEYFGDVEHSIAKLRSLRIFGESHEADVMVDAARYAANNQWLDTGVKIESARTLAIVAGGEVELRPSVPGTYVAGPRGYTRTKADPIGGGFKKKGGVMDTGRTYPGTLLGKIGPNGDTFVIGERFEGIPEQEGKLYLQIMASPYDNSSTGSYQVKVTVKD
jgi:hypothetical protein